ncbi:MAG TPA: family 43 glycosylhydrolase [bacterium]|nr:family 43 glycosylhydrolase [bacterium]HPP30181.1 family 43 glycosylhydrolase [bacterium]
MGNTAEKKGFIIPVERWPASFRYVYHNKGEYVNDHCIFKHKNVYHLYYISGEVGKGCYDIGNEIKIGHAISKDLYHWKKVEDALVYDRKLPWENRGIYAPYVIEYRGVFYMFYSSHNIEKAQFMCLATSIDLYNWQKSPFNPIFLPSTEWAFWDKNSPCSCRDPHIIYEKKYGFLMYYVADMKKDPTLSCIAVAFSDDLIHWQDAGPVLIRKHSFYEGTVCKTESPCVIKYEDRYYLFYRHGNGTKFSISDTPLRWEGRDSYFLAPSHASEILKFNGKWYITSCGKPLRDITLRHHRTKGLYIGKIVWKRGFPFVI